jgi:mannan endo-1,4-beta-mannosidase
MSKRCRWLIPCCMFAVSMIATALKAAESPAAPVQPPAKQEVAAPAPAPGATATPAHAKETGPVSPDATPEVKALLHFLYAISGQHTLTGQHNFPAHKDQYTVAAAKSWGKTPVLFGKDWGFAAQGDKDSAYVRDDIVQEMTDWYKKGALPTICWHQAPPTAEEPVAFSGRGAQPMLRTVQGQLMPEQYKDLFTPGTEINQRWTRQVDALVPYFKKLEEARVPILWRPVQEMNGNWFWWGGRKDDTVVIYKMMFDRLVKHHKLKGLLWIWSVDRPNPPSLQFEECWPGPEYVDILSLDCYGQFEQRFYDGLVKLANGKPVCLAEVDNPPSLEVLTQQPLWTWWMPWAGMGRGGRGSAPISKMVQDPRLWCLEDPEYIEATNPIRAASGLPPLKPPAPAADAAPAAKDAPPAGKP